MYSAKQTDAHSLNPNKSGGVAVARADCSRPGADAAGNAELVASIFAELWAGRTNSKLPDITLDAALVE